MRIPIIRVRLQRVKRLTGNVFTSNNRKLNQTALITGITGQDGFYLADLLLADGVTVFGTTRDLDSESARMIIDLLSDRHSAEVVQDRVVLRQVNLLEEVSVKELIQENRPDEIYHLAGQSRVGRSFEIPQETYAANVSSTLNLLKAIQMSGRTETRFCLAGSGEIFGETNTATEDSPYQPRSPYARSKLAAQLAVESFRESTEFFACTSILFNHESPRRSSDFVTGKIADGVARIARGLQQELVLGNIKIGRDWGFAGDYMNAMRKMLAAETPEDFIVSTGEWRPLTEFLDAAFKVVGLDWQAHTISSRELFRPVDTNRLCGDSTKIRSKLNWRPETSFEAMVEAMVREKLRNLST